MPDSLPPQQIDANRRTINSNEAFVTPSETWTFVAGTTGAVGAHTVFTVTGDVVISVFGKCTTNIAGSGTGEVGVTGNTAALIAQTTGTDIDAGDVWQDGTPTVGIGAGLTGAKPIVGGLDVLLTIASNTFTGGVMTFYAIWRPLSEDGLVVATTPA